MRRFLISISFFSILFTMMTLHVFAGLKFKTSTESENDSIKKAEEKQKQKEKEEEQEHVLGIHFNKPWKYHIGDDSAYAKVSYDDSVWPSIKKGQAVDLQDDSVLSDVFDIIWFRTVIRVDSQAVDKPLGLYFHQSASAAEIYVDGKPVGHFGKVGRDLRSEDARFNVNPKPFPVVISKVGSHLIAVRFSSFHSKLLTGKKSGQSHGFEISFSDLQDDFNSLFDNTQFFPLIFLLGVFLTLGVVHFIMFSYFRSHKQNLFFGLYCIGIAFLMFFGYYAVNESDFEVYSMLTRSFVYLAPLMVVPLVAFYHTIYYGRLLRIFWIIIFFYACTVIFTFMEWQANKAFVAILIFASIVEIFRSHLRAVIKGKDGALILGLGIFYLPLAIIILMIIVIVQSTTGDENVNLNMGRGGAMVLGYSLALSIPFSITLYLSRNFARVNRKLVEQVDEIKQLSEKTLLHEAEKKKLLEEQNTMLESKVEERTRELADKNELILEKNKEITDNLTYAKRIQAALLPDMVTLKSAFRECFVLYLPKDIVSGDFYAFFQKENRLLLAVADCTGHGVSGAFMSMIGSSLLSQLINIRQITRPSEILDQLSEEVITSLNQRSGESNDGMDIALCSFDLQSGNIEFAGANRPLWLIRKNSLSVVKPDKSPIGGMQVLREKKFTNNNLQVFPGDCVYLFSDGFADQFGGESGKKLMTGRLKELLLQINSMSMDEQEQFLASFIIEWKGKNEQLDDILVIGIRI